MAVRRMIHQDVICCDDFLDMSFEAQALFFQLQIKADEYGFVQSPRSTLRMMGASNESLETLIDSGFVIHFHSGVIVMTHWNKANTRRSDREAKMRFPDEYKQLHVDEETGLYSMRDGNGMPTPSQKEPTVIPSISNSLSPSVNQTEAVASASASAPVQNDGDADAVAYPADPDFLSAYFLINHVKVRVDEIKILFDSGFDLDSLFWMMQMAQNADNPTAYFNSVVEDKEQKGATTIAVLRASECRTATDFKFFDRHVKLCREDYEKFLQYGAQEYARQRNESIQRYAGG